MSPSGSNRLRSLPATELSPMAALEEVVATRRPRRPLLCGVLGRPGLLSRARGRSPRSTRTGSSTADPADSSISHPIPEAEES